LGFNSAEDIFLAKELAALGVETILTTADGSVGIKGFVTDGVKGFVTDAAPHSPPVDYLFVCGPEGMMKAVYNLGDIPGQYSFESRMGCGFGACMCCSVKTAGGAKRVCGDGPVFTREEILWRT